MRKGRGSYRRALAETFALWVLGLAVFLAIKCSLGV